ncbi:MAG: hypothetical protein A3G71_00425 [Gammaproteobacteria bacterium RIFCSPLOWO2_12_FULL_38_14]|nr:MAG: hypothetical protein A3G71_00425 [Gammaproteobacteria bacterium RIFCSPLOWO2_12_FULL_38_14]
MMLLPVSSLNVFAKTGKNSPYKDEKMLKRQRVKALFFETWDVLVGNSPWELSTSSANNYYNHHYGILDYLFPIQLLSKSLLCVYLSESSFGSIKARNAYYSINASAMLCIVFPIYIVFQIIQCLIGLVLTLLVTLVGAVVLSSNDLCAQSAVLDFQCHDIGDSGVESLVEELKKNRAIKELRLEYNVITDAGAKILAEFIKTNNTIIKLNLSHNSISEVGARDLLHALKYNHTLTNLNLSHNSISTQAQAEVLKANTAITTLDISYNLSSPMSVTQTLAEALGKNTTLRTLNLLSDRNISDLEAQWLAQALKDNYTIISLTLFYTPTSSMGIQELANALKGNTTLETLELSSNHRINEAEASMLALALESNHTLASLKLGRIQIDPKGIQVLVELRNNTTLTNLELSCDARTGDIRALAQALENNTTLKALTLLGYNGINDTDATVLAQALQNNRRLKILSLEEMPMTNTGTQTLLEALQQNYFLKKLSLMSHEETTDSFSQLLERNKRISERKLSAFLKEGSADDNKILNDISQRLEKLKNYIEEKKLPLTDYASELHRLCSAVLSLDLVVSADSEVSEIECYKKALSLLFQPFNDMKLQHIANDRIKDCLGALLPLTAEKNDQNEKNKHAAYATLLAYHLRHKPQDAAFGIAIGTLNPKLGLEAFQEKFICFDDLVSIAREVLKTLEEKQKTANSSHCDAELINDPEQKERELLTIIIQRGDYHHAAVTALLSLPSFVKELDAENITVLSLLEEFLIEPKRESTRSYTLGSLEQTPEALFKYLTEVADQYAVKIQEPDYFRETLAEAKKIVAVPDLNLEEKTDSAAGTSSGAASSSSEFFLPLFSRP